MLLLTDLGRVPDPLALLPQLPRGAGVILRDYGHPEREALARSLKAGCRKHRLRLLIAGNPHLARRLRADGIHAPQRDLSQIPCWRKRYPRARISAAVHDLPSLLRASRYGADWLLLSPLFATASHPGQTPLGLVRFARIATLSPLPVYALGGIRKESLNRLKLLKTAGWATVSGVG